MGQGPAEIREQIEQTRQRMGDTVDALGYKVDVPARAKDSISDKAQSVKAKITGAGSQISDATPDGHDIRHAGRQAAGVVQENPLGLAIGATAAGFLAGMLIPSSNVEHERLGPMADQLKEQARQTGQEVIDRGTQLAQETAETAVDTAKQAAAEIKATAQQSSHHHAEELKSSAQERIEQTREKTPQ
jgi:gas vesicle protein